MAKSEKDLEEIFAVKLSRDLTNFPSDGDIDYIRNKFDIAKGKTIAIFNNSGEWVSTHTA